MSVMDRVGADPRLLCSTWIRSTRFRYRRRRRSLPGRLVARARRRARAQIHHMFSSRGTGFRRLAEAHAGGVAGDTLLAMALAGTLFFDVPSTEGRDNVALYLLITLAPFALIGPFLGGVYERFPGAYRGGLVLSTSLRAVVAPIMAIGLDTFLLFPLAFVMLVLSRLFGISRSSLLPVVLAGPRDLITANAQVARIGVFAGALAVPVGAVGNWILGPWFALVVAAIIFAWAAFKAARLPSLDAASATALVEQSQSSSASSAAYVGPPRPVRLARFATAGVRFLNGFLLLLVAFAFRDAEAGIYDFGVLLFAAGGGFFFAALMSPVLDRYISGEPMVVVGLARGGRSRLHCRTGVQPRGCGGPVRGGRIGVGNREVRLRRPVAGNRSGTGPRTGLHRLGNVLPGRLGCRRADRDRSGIECRNSLAPHVSRRGGFDRGRSRGAGDPGRLHLGAAGSDRGRSTPAATASRARAAW